MSSPPPLVPLLVALVLLTGALHGCESRTVVVVPVDRVEVRPSLLSLLEGGATTLEVVARGPSGAVLRDRDVAWSSSSPSLVSVDAQGSVQALAPGEARVRAEVEGVVGEAAITVLAGPSLVLDPLSVALAAVSGESAPVATVAVRNGGNGRIMGLGTRVTYEQGEAEGWLVALLSGTAAPTTLDLRASAERLPPGQYHATVSVEADGGLEAVLEVELVVEPPPPVIVVDPEEVAFSAVAGGQQQVRVAVTNGGGGVLEGLTARVRYDDESSGWLSAVLESDTAPTELTLRASAAGLTPGNYRATALISSPVAAAEGVVTVTFTVSGGGPVP